MCIGFSQAASCLTGHDRGGVEFLGKTLDPGEASSTLVALFFIGLTLLVTVLILLSLITCQRKRTYYRGTHRKCMLPTDSL